MRNYMKSVFLSILSFILLSCLSMTVLASDVSESDEDFIFLSDLNESFISEYAALFAENAGYPDYYVDVIYPYVVNDSWIGYLVGYSNGQGFGFSVIDFSASPGHYISEFAFGLDELPFSFSDDVMELNADSVVVSESGSLPFSYDIGVMNESVRSGVMNGNIRIPKDAIFRTDGELVVNSVMEKRMISQYDPALSLISQDDLVDATDHYACPVAASIAMIRQEHMDLGYDTAYLVRWLWNRMEIVPEWQYDLDNVDAWPSGYVEDYLARNHPRIDGTGVYDVIHSGCRAQRCKIALVGETTTEQRNSWFGGICGYKQSFCDVYSKYSLEAEYFVNVVNANKPSLFFFSQSCTGLDVEQHAVNVVGYAKTQMYFGADGNSNRGETIYIAVADGWHDDAIRYMDVTNVKFMPNSTYDTVLYVFNIKQ